MSSAKSSQSSLHKDNCSSALLSSLNVLWRLSVKGELIGWTQFNYVTVYLWLIKTIPFCAHAFSFFMSVWKQIYSSWYYLLSQSWTFFFFFNQVVFSFIKQTLKYLGIHVEPRPREIFMKWCQAVSENNNDSSAIFWPRWEQLLIPRAFSIFSLTFPMPKTWMDTQTHFYFL